MSERERERNAELYDNCPCCSKELLMGCCLECGESYDPNP